MEALIHTNNNPEAAYSNKFTILYINNMQFRPDGFLLFCRSIYLTESEAGSRSVVRFIIIYIIKITPSEKNKIFVLFFELMSGVIYTE